MSPDKRKWIGKEFENYSNAENYFRIEIGNLVVNGRKSVLDYKKDLRSNY
jgi:hypothetical protein